LEANARHFIRERQGLTNELFENEDELKLESFTSSVIQQSITGSWSGTYIWSFVR